MNEFVNSNFTITIVDSDHPEKVKDNYDFSSQVAIKFGMDMTDLNF